jgi:hypothetical protein
MHSVNPWRDRLFALLGLKRNKPLVPFEIHPETVYRDLVHRQIKRSARSRHVCQIVLVYRTNGQGGVVFFCPKILNKTISILSSSCRDTDYIGWYRQDRILGILLTALQSDSAREGCENLTGRLMGSLHSAVTVPKSDTLKIRPLDESELTAFIASSHSVSSSGSNN